MSDTMDSAQGQETGTGGYEGNGDSGQGSEDYSLAGGFLEGVPEEHRSILEPYVKKWDAGVTRRFQDLHSRYQPYQQLGDPETLQQAYNLYEQINTNPQAVYNALREALGDDLDQGNLDADDDDENDLGLPPELAQQISTHDQALELIAQYILDQQTTQQEAQEDAQLESYLGLLKDEFGDFDEDYVLTKMYAGMDGEAAVKAYQKLVQQQINQAGAGQNNLPPVLSGGGSVPADAPNDVRNLSRSDTKSLIAAIMRQANEG